MPGLVCLISNLPKEACEEKVKVMINSMMHEDDYEHGTYSESSLKTYIGWTRHKHPFTNAMPIVNQNKDVLLFLSGEVFMEGAPTKEMQKESEENSISCAQYLVHLYEKLGEKFFESLNGNFTGIVVDKRINKTFVFNDRYGIKRLFRHENRGGYYFANEAKAIMAAVPETREYDWRGVADMLTCGCTMGEQSLFKDISIVNGASLFVYEDKKDVQEKQYFNVREWEESAVVDGEDFLSCFVHDFKNVARKYFEPEEHLGISLTGGIDSRLVAACLPEKYEKIPCYTFGSMYRENYDVKIANEVAEACGLKHHAIVLGDEFLSEFKEYIKKAVYISDGYCGLDGAAELYVNNIASDIAPIRITGNYGGEFMRAVRAFKAEPVDTSFLNEEMKVMLGSALSGFKEKVESLNPVTFAAFVQAPHQGYGRRAIEESQLILRTPYLDNELMEKYYRIPVGSDYGMVSLIEAIRKYNPSLINILTDRKYIGSNASVRKMTYGIMQTLTFRLEYLTSHGIRPSMLKICKLVPFIAIERMFLGMHKFHHFRYWITKSLGNTVREILEDGINGDALPFINKKGALSILEEHIQGRKNNIKEINHLLMLTVMSTCFLRK